MWFAKGARELAGEVGELCRQWLAGNWRSPAEYAALSRHRELALALQDVQSHWQDNIATLERQVEHHTSVDETQLRELQAALNLREQQQAEAAPQAE